MVSQWAAAMATSARVNNHISVFFFRNIFVRILFFLTTTEQRVFVKNGQEHELRRKDFISLRRKNKTRLSCGRCSCGALEEPRAAAAAL